MGHQWPPALVNQRPSRHNKSIKKHGTKAGFQTEYDDFSTTKGFIIYSIVSK